MQCVFPRPVSNHFPVLLEGRGLRRVPSLFRFENMWLKVEGFKDLLKLWWEGDNFNGSSSFILAAKLKALKSILKEWNRTTKRQPLSSSSRTTPLHPPTHPHTLFLTNKRINFISKQECYTLSYIGHIQRVPKDNPEGGLCLCYACQAQLDRD